VLNKVAARGALIFGLSLIAMTGSYADDVEDNEILKTSCHGDLTCHRNKLSNAIRVRGLMIQQGGCREICRSKCGPDPSCWAKWGQTNLANLDKLISNLRSKVQNP